MQEVKIDRADLLAALRENRAQHRAAFEEALEGYRGRMQSELERRIRDLKRGRHIDQYIRLPEPEDHTEDYDRVVRMAEMSVEDVITLSQNDFAMYVMDQWHWKQSWLEVTHQYTG